MKRKLKYKEVQNNQEIVTQKNKIMIHNSFTTKRLQDS